MNTYENEIIKPMLTEPGVKYFLNETLKQCHIFKVKYQNIVLLLSSYLFYAFWDYRFLFLLILYAFLN
jgi:hypothetical protein